MALNKNIVTDYGCPTNGTSDSRPAFLAFKADAQGQDATLTIPAHTYTFKTNAGSNADNRIFEGISNLTVLGIGATLNDSGGTGGFIIGCAGVPVASPQSTARLQQAFAGQNTVTLNTIADNSIFTNGNYVLLTAFDQQGSGQPPNPFYFEYLQISNINAGTGVITFTTPLKFNYSSSFPNYDVGDAFEPDQGGPATLYVLPASWNCSIDIRGLTIDQVGQTYSIGRNITFTNVTSVGAGGLIPSTCQTFTMDGCSVPSAEMEVDKITETVMIQNSSTIHQMKFQSSSPHLFILDNSTVSAALNGTPLNSIVRNSSVIGSVGLGCIAYGRTDSFQSDDSSIGGLTFSSYFTDVDAASYTIDKSTISSSTGPLPWSVPETRMVFQGSQDNETGFTNRTCSKSGSNTLVSTSLTAGWPNVPRSGGTILKVGPHPCPRLRLRNTVGCAKALDYSQVGAYDRPYGAYSKRSYSANTIISPESVPVWGRLVQIKVTVAPAFTTSGALSLKVCGQFSAGALEPNNTNTTWNATIDLKSSGVRIITPVSVVGNVGADSITIPGGLWFTGNQAPFISGSVTGGDPGTVEIEYIMDQEFAPLVSKGLNRWRSK
jgi:hypothetical protein